MAVNPGTAAAIGAGAALASTAYGVISGERNAKRTKNQYAEQSRSNNEANEKISKAQDKASADLLASKKKLAAGVQRSRSARSAGALFQEQASANAPAGSTLG